MLQDNILQRININIDSGDSYIYHIDGKIYSLTHTDTDKIAVPNRNLILEFPLILGIRIVKLFTNYKPYFMIKDIINIILEFYNNKLEDDELNLLINKNKLKLGQKIKRKLLFKKTSSFIEVEPIDIHKLDYDENLIVKNKILGDNLKIYKLRLDELESI
jgi:hypothetical protein